MVSRESRKPRSRRRRVGIHPPSLVGEVMAKRFGEHPTVLPQRLAVTTVVLSLDDAEEPPQLLER